MNNFFEHFVISGSVYFVIMNRGFIEWKTNIQILNL